MNSRYDKIQEMLEDYKEQLPKPNSEWPQYIRQAVYYIHKNIFNNNLSVGTFKKELNIRDNNFSSRFAFYTGQIPNKYYNSLRVKIAKKILEELNNKVQISELTFYLGYNHVQTFSMVFKAHTGYSPKRWNLDKE